MKRAFTFLVLMIVLGTTIVMGYTPPSGPTITSFTPASGPVGTLVTITGTNLNSPTTFTIGGVSAIAVSNDGTTLVGMIMPGATTGTIDINTASGSATSATNFTVTTNLPPSAQQGDKLVGNDPFDAALQGHSVSISADGNTAIVGGYSDNYNQGAAWVYTRSGGVWIQQGGKLVGTGNVGAARQGWSVSISADGNTVILGGYNDNNFKGAVWVFTRNGGVWSQQGNKLVGTYSEGGISAPVQGFSVSLSADGNTALVGGYGVDNGQGAAWVFTRSAGVWNQQGNKLTGTGGTDFAWQGYSVCLSADGNTAIVGGKQDNSNEGAAWVYTRSAGVWSQQGSKLVGTGYTGAANQGNSVSLSADGNTAIVGGYADDSNQGAAWVYTRSGGVWNQQGSKLVGTGNIGAANQGNSVSLSADGNIAIVGGNYDNGQEGAVWVYTRSAGIWNQQSSKLVGTGNITSAQQGVSVSLSADGYTALVGGEADNGFQGAAWVFVPTFPPSITSFTPANGPVGTLVTITGTNLNSPTAFTIGGVSAIAVSNDGTTLVGMVMPGAISGAIGITTLGGSAVSATNFTVIANVPPIAQQGGKLIGTGNTGAASQGYSVSVSADGNTAIVGGYTDNSNKGAAWVYTRSAGGWNPQGGKLVGTGDKGTAQQGYSVSLSADGNTAIVGGNNNASGQGAVWIYTRSAGVWNQQGNRLVGTGGSLTANQGCSVSLSADGNTAIVGGFADNSSQGAAWVYTRSAGVWSQQGSKLLGTGGTTGAYQGFSVSLSADGNTAIVGGYNNDAGQGAAWVYTRSSGVWNQQGSKLVGIGNSGAAQQGRSVSLSADGNTAMVGGSMDNSGQGAVWVFTRSAGVWNQQGSKLVGTGNTGAAHLGNSVSLSADGNTAMVGGFYDNNFQGAVWVYTRSGGVWSQQGSKLVGTGNTGEAYQGCSVGLSADGNTAIVGGYADNINQGAAWVYYGASVPGITSFSPDNGPVGTLVTITGANLSSPTTFIIGGVSAITISNDGTTLVGMVMPGATTGTISITTVGGSTTSATNFTVTANLPPAAQQGNKLVSSDFTGAAWQGYSVGVSADGNTAIVGGPFDNGHQGAAWVYTRSGDVWSQQGDKLVSSDAIGAAYQGISVSISADGNTALIGGYGDDNFQGAAWVFTRSTGVWSQQGKLVCTDNNGAASQGSSVSLSADGNTALVGGANNNNGQGAAWVYTRSAGIWIQQGNKLVGTGGSATAIQGCSVSLSADGNTAIIGGSADNNYKGAAWVFTRSSGDWIQQGSKLVGTGGTATTGQGVSVSLSADGNTALVGGYGDNNDQGAAWVFTRGAEGWDQQGSKLVGTGNSGAASQGYSVSLSADGNTALISGEMNNDGQGAVWAFTRSGGVWIQHGSKLVGLGNSGPAVQGISVCLSADGNTALVGGYKDNSDQGAAWVFNGPCELPTIESQETSTQMQCLGGTFAAITVTATGDGLSYQWYSHLINSNSEGESLNSENGAQTFSYTPQATSVGTLYYYCVVNGTCGVDTSAVSEAFITNGLPMADVATNPTCYGSNTGSAEVTVSGWLPDYSYLWSTVPIQSTSIAIGLAADTYTVTVTDANGCTDEVSATVLQPDEALVANPFVVEHVNCFGDNTGMLNANVSGGTIPYSYFWSTSPEQTIAVASSLSAGDYWVTVTDANGCTTEASALVIQPDGALVANASVVHNVNCFSSNSGVAEVSVSGGTIPYSYLWSTSPEQTASMATGLIVGTYTVTITDGNSCSTTTSANIIQSEALTATAAVVSNVSIYEGSDGSVTVSAVGGETPYSYIWSSYTAQTGQTASGLAAGTYSVTITDGNSCTVTSSIVLTQPTPPSVQVKDLILTDIGSSQAVIDWTRGNGHGCAVFIIEGSTGLASPANNVSYPANTVFGTSASQVGSTGWYCVYDGTGTNVKVTGLDPSTDYRIHICEYKLGSKTYNKGGSTGNPVNFSTYSILVATASVVENVSCSGLSDGSAIVNVSGGNPTYSYMWSCNPVQTAQTATGLSAGTYTVTVTDGVAESITSSIAIQQPDVLAASASVSKPISCNLVSDGSVTVSAIGGTVSYHYTWSTIPAQSAVTATGLSMGTYSVTVSDANGCTATSSATITDPVQWLPQLGGPTPVCQNTTGHVYTTDAGMTNYQWVVTGGIITAGGTSSDNTITITWLTAGNQNVSVNYNAPAGCVPAAAKVFVVFVRVGPAPILSGDANVTQGQAVNYSTPYITGNTYSWNASHGNPEICFPNRNCLTLTWDFPCGIINPGYVKVTETNVATGCSTTVTKLIAIAP